ncbi:MAG: hypothetical protein NT045_06720 [Candidatus Aureabacteria bacterium]|nr:hypothetical protein [Candidatus Auribacterota bacterium]
MKVIIRWGICACIAAAAAARAAGGVPDEATAREAFNTLVERYIEATRDDLKTNTQYRNASVSILSSEVKKTGSLVTPFAGRVKYLIEYDDPAQKGSRLTHPYLMRTTWFDGRWDIDPHGHRMRKNVTDLDKKETEILFPNI